MIQGEVFLYDVSDNQGTILKEIPTEICKICKVINDNLYKYAINVNKLGTAEYYSMMPLGLQRLYDQHKAGSLSPEQYLGTAGSGYVIVDDPEAICLSLNNMTSTKSVPTLSYLFPSLLRLMEEEENEVVENKANNLKMIHMQYDVDEEGDLLARPAEWAEDEKSPLVRLVNLHPSYKRGRSALGIASKVIARIIKQKSDEWQATVIRRLEKDQKIFMGIIRRYTPALREIKTLEHLLRHRRDPHVGKRYFFKKLKLAPSFVYGYFTALGHSLS